MGVEVIFFAQESFRENIRLGRPADERAVAVLTRELQPHRNAFFRIWNGHAEARVPPLVKVMAKRFKALDGPALL